MNTRRTRTRRGSAPSNFSVSTRTRGKSRSDGSNTNTRARLESSNSSSSSEELEAIEECSFTNSAKATGDKDTTAVSNVSSQQIDGFIKKLWDVTDDESITCMRWSRTGDYFVIEPVHEFIDKVLPQFDTLDEEIPEYE